MARRTVTAPNGESWQVRRLWAPRLQGERLWSRLRRRFVGSGRRARGLGEGADIADGCGAGVLDDLLIGVAVVLVIVLLIFFVVPLLLALADLVVIVLLTGLGILARVLLRRPWTIEATGPGATRRTWRVVGWRKSREAVGDVAGALAHGHPPPPGYQVSKRPGATPAEG